MSGSWKSGDVVIWDNRSTQHAPRTDSRLKKRIVRTVIHELVADIDDAASEIVLIVHWVSEIRLPKRRRWQRNSTSAKIIEAVHQLVLIASDDLIADLLNRNSLNTSNSNRWTRERVTSSARTVASRCSSPAKDGIEPWLNLSNAAKLLKIAPGSSPNPTKSQPSIRYRTACGCLLVPP
ncbi:TauD/TfdA family dioxygenase [Bradyrhizobium sp. CB1650]|uniref:TauD/TfdA family dioxygenase n=1 Tax=Bradyrhizobium sp. CB1650 TaxID=3039153 RepID=UPI0024358850|nr:TauD/TfdA family dioxygenase [Bradyrhizobium sp. CB1650]WGD51059.1 TauD/TfdA family dioxygenase [Bradyrhizobium sp. CB1650]